MEIIVRPVFPKTRLFDGLGMIHASLNFSAKQDGSLASIEGPATQNLLLVCLD
jgi:hypothetical protein